MRTDASRDRSGRDAGWSFALRAASTLMAVVAAGFTAWMYLTRTFLPGIKSQPPPDPPAWLYIVTAFWALLALGYAFRPARRLAPWLLLPLLFAVLGWARFFDRERDAAQERLFQLKSSEILARGRRASAAVLPLQERAAEAARVGFADLDADANGQLSLDEFASRPHPLLFDRAGRDLDRLEPAIAAYQFRDSDFDQDGRVSEAEWVCKVDSVSRQSRLLSLPLHRERAFGIVDGDGDGRVSREELMAAPRACRPYLDEDVVSMHERRDVDRDGRLTVEEWGRPGR